MLGFCGFKYLLIVIIKNVNILFILYVINKREPIFAKTSHTSDNFFLFLSNLFFCGFIQNYRYFCIFLISKNSLESSEFFFNFFNSFLYSLKFFKYEESLEIKFKFLNKGSKQFFFNLYFERFSKKKRFQATEKNKRIKMIFYSDKLILK